ncbi:MAG: methyltransferase domain-containing protein [Gemmatimonadaceae bacterium]|nr:methyltransferase domain-containing protein [Gemmatimonadaceae bacterium]
MTRVFVARLTAGVLAGASLALACGARAERVRVATGETAVAVGQDTIGPLAPPGAPAKAFPAPSRPVADIVAPRWTAEDDRDGVGEFTRVALLAGIASGQQVADIGAGDGYYVTRLSPLVGPSGVVYGQDIIPDYLALLQQRVRREQLRNVRVVLGDPHDPRLPSASLDVAIMIHMYHEIEQPFGVLYNLATAFKPGGRLVILDLDRPTFGHGTPPSLLRCELRAVGYRERRFTRTTDEEYVAVFEAPSATQRPTPEAITAALTRSPCRAP